MKAEKWIQLLQLLGAQLQRFGEQPHETGGSAKWSDFLQTNVATPHGAAQRQDPTRAASEDGAEKSTKSRSRRRRRGETRRVSASLARTYEITLANPEREFGRGEMLVLSGWPTATATAYAPVQQRRLSEAFRLISVATRGLNQLLEMVNDLDKRVRALETRADLTARVEALESQLAKRASDSEVLEKLAAPLIELDKRVPELMTRLAALEAVGASDAGGDAER